MNCPCCGDGELIYQQTDKVHAWVCNLCPIVMLELYDSSNIEALKKLL